MKLRLLLLVFLVSGFAFAQTTVTLQDQCNCEVLSGTAVTIPGAISPAGADTGDIYVNTDSIPPLSVISRFPAFTAKAVFNSLVGSPSKSGLELPPTACHAAPSYTYN